MYTSFKVDLHVLEVSHLQFADDTILVSIPSVNNLLTIKAILRIFKITLGLKVNFVKSCIFRVGSSWTRQSVFCTANLVLLPSSI